MIKYLLFDADDTLFDFGKCERYAFSQAYTAHGFGTADDEIYGLYNEINTDLWNKFEKYEISKDELVVKRFEKLFEKLKINYDPKAYNIDYLACLGDAPFLFDGAEKLCGDIFNSQKYTMYIVTNGVESTQISRFYGSPIHVYFADIFVSEKIGYQKPMPEYFDHIFKTTNIAPRETMIIGDSLTSDIKGGNNANLLTCWYNPDNKINNTDVICDYIVHNYDELRSILNI